MPKKITLSEQFYLLKGELEIIVKDRYGRILNRHREPNLIKIFAKEMLSHRLPYSNVWDPTGGSGSGDWVPSGIDPLEEFSAKYMLFGASFDNAGLPLDMADTRYYELDPGTGGYIAKTPQVGADNMGGLINAIPISEPSRPLKRIESVSFESSYQPPDSPLMQDYVRAINNVLVLETTLRTNEYNGFGTSASDYFTITEVALAGGAPLGATIGACECNPEVLFLEGVGAANNLQIAATASGTSTITIDPAVAPADVTRIVEGDQIFIVAQAGSTETYDTMGQISPFYLATSKAVGGHDIELDRTPVDSTGTAITGNIGIYRSTLRLFSQRILSVPFKKSVDMEIVCRWRIVFN